MRKPAPTLPMMMAELAFASAETIWHRTAMIAMGTCTALEYQKMVAEKMRALQVSGAAMMAGESPAAVLHPWHKGATANARRLRK